MHRNGNAFLNGIKLTTTNTVLHGNSIKLQCYFQLVSAIRITYSTKTNVTMYYITT
jgi:hypothetical protein